MVLHFCTSFINQLKMQLDINLQQIEKKNAGQNQVTNQGSIYLVKRKKKYAKCFR